MTIEIDRAWDETRIRLGTSADPEMIAMLKRYFTEGWEAREYNRIHPGTQSAAERLRTYYDREDGPYPPIPGETQEGRN